MAYLEAESQSGSEAMQKFEADKDLLIKIAALDENRLPNAADHPAAFGVRFARLT
ncbi:hypothetical protein [Achromobacter ruhlandii]|uniref:hypothetical protein n=1 Tax=Achromobacter ruhlandii TaxID=72557 RepID=UPI0012E90F42|nr:hypothetical protein [Achromobacter ruhlandii]